MTVKEVAWVAGIVTAAEGIIFWISPVLRESARGVGRVVGSAIASSHWLLWTSTWIFSILMLVAETILSAVLILGLVWLLRVFAKAILNSIAAFQREFERFAITLSRKLTDGAKDAGFMAIVGILSAVVAYLNTEDFFKEWSMLKMMGVAAMCYAALKVIMLIPVRSTQILSGVLTFFILAATLLLLNHKHPFYPIHDPSSVTTWLWNAEIPRIVGASGTVILSAVSILYPFTPGEWKRIFKIDE